MTKIVFSISEFVQIGGETCSVPRDRPFHDLPHGVLIKIAHKMRCSKSIELNTKVLLTHNFWSQLLDKLIITSNQNETILQKCNSLLPICNNGG